MASGSQDGAWPAAAGPAPQQCSTPTQAQLDSVWLLGQYMEQVAESRQRQARRDEKAARWATAFAQFQANKRHRIGHTEETEEKEAEKETEKEEEVEEKVKEPEVAAAPPSAQEEEEEEKEEEKLGEPLDATQEEGEEKREKEEEGGIWPWTAPTQHQPRKQMWKLLDMPPQ